MNYKLIWHCPDGSKVQGAALFSSEKEAREDAYFRIERKQAPSIQFEVIPVEIVKELKLEDHNIKEFNFTVQLPIEARLVNKEFLDQLHKYLQMFLEKATPKYIAGQLEHKGNIKSKDTLKEAYYEAIDMIFYLSAEAEKRVDEINKKL